MEGGFSSGAEVDQDSADPDGEEGEGAPGIGIRELLRRKETEGDDEEGGEGLGASVSEDIDDRFGFELFVGF